MAIYTLKEFAALCGVSTSYINVNKSRGKVVINKDGMIDSDNQINQLFYIKRTEGRIENIPVPPPPVSIKTKTPVPPPAGSESVDSPDSPEYKTLAMLDRERRLMELEKIAADVRLLKLKEAKLNGILIPTELVKILFKQHTKSIVTAFHNAAENLITEFSKRKQLTGSEIAELRHELTHIINHGSETAVTDSLKQVQNIQDEYSQKRERGERK